MNATDEAALGDGYTDDDPDAPDCLCPDDPRAPANPQCEFHGERYAEPPGTDESQGGGPHALGGPPPMPSPPEHECDPEALVIHPDHGWACTACGLILGGDREHAPRTPEVGPGREPGHEPQRGAALARRDPIGAAIRTLDPTKVQGPQQCHEEILYIIDRLSQAEYAQRSATHEKAEAETAFRRAYDRAVVERRGQGSADVRAAEARIQADAELTRLETAKAVEAAIKGAAHSWRSMLSGYQTAARLVEASYQGHGRY